MMRKIVLLVLAGALGCGSSSGSGGNNPSTNHAPSANPGATSTAVLMGQSTQLQSHALDQDGDALTYSWTQTSPTTPQGTFSSTTSESPTWTAPTVSATTPFTLAVTVSDGKGGTTTGDVTVFAKISSDVSFMAEVAPQFTTTCAACHSPPAPAALLNLSYAALVNVPATVDCPGMLRVKPGDPDNSVLFLSLAGSSCGARMPQGNVTYYDQNPAKLALIRSWIQAGAPNN